MKLPRQDDEERPTPPPVREYDHSFGVDVPLPRCDDWHNVNRFTDD